MAQGRGPIPMTVLGGYLGAGKTTLLNAVLSGAGEARIAVVVNDFGAVNVDADLVRSRGETLELSNGCVCCSLSDGMGAVMERLRGMDPAPDLVLVEVSGVGDPAAVAAWADHPGFRRGGVVVCADATTVRERAADRWVADTVRRQLAVADVLLLTKLDLVPPGGSEEVMAWLGEQAPGTPVETARDAMVARLQGADPPTVRDPGGDVVGHVDDAAHRRWSATTDGLVDLERVTRFLSDLPPSVVRAKGVLRTAAAPARRTVVHLVGTRLDVTDDGEWRPSASSSLVLVGTGAADADEDLGALLVAALAGAG